MLAYDTALEVNPNYPEAMEYRAEALLGLGRVEEAQEAYQRLAAISEEHAAELLSAMKEWAGAQANVAAAAELGLADWIAARERAGAEGSASSWR